jgi:hypothetical protein
MALCQPQGTRVRQEIESSLGVLRFHPSQQGPQGRANDLGVLQSRQVAQLAEHLAVRWGQDDARSHAAVDTKIPALVASFLPVQIKYSLRMHRAAVCRKVGVGLSVQCAQQSSLGAM